MGRILIPCAAAPRPVSFPAVGSPRELGRRKQTCPPARGVVSRPSAPCGSRAIRHDRSILPARARPPKLSNDVLGKAISLRRITPKVATAALFLSTDNPLARVLLLIVSLVPVALFEAAVFRSMWQWFVTPLWPRPISYAEAVGLTLLTFLVLRTPWSSLTVKERPDLWMLLKQIAAALLGRALIWGLAAACHLLLF
jgi:hypothetical protein